MQFSIEIALPASCLVNRKNKLSLNFTYHITTPAFTRNRNNLSLHQWPPNIIWALVMVCDGDGVWWCYHILWILLEVLCWTPDIRNIRCSISPPPVSTSLHQSPLPMELMSAGAWCCIYQLAEERERERYNISAGWEYREIISRFSASRAGCQNKRILRERWAEQPWY